MTLKSKNSLLVQCAGCSFKPKIGTDFIFPSSAPLWIKADFKGHELSPPSHPNLCIHNHLLVKKWGIAVLCIRISFKCSYYKPTTPFAVSMKESDKLDDWMMPSNCHENCLFSIVKFSKVSLAWGMWNLQSKESFFIVIQHYCNWLERKLSHLLRVNKSPSHLLKVIHKTCVFCWARIIYESV